jgi:nickel transport protein
MMSYAGVLGLLICVWLPSQVLAHDLQHSVDEAEAVYVRFFSADGHDFDFESYEVYRGGEEAPFQVGRTDARGRLVFLPDRAGAWRVRVFSEDGHGADFSLSTDARGGVEKAGESLLERYPRIVVGVSIIFGIFGVIALLTRGKSGE